MPSPFPGMDPFVEAQEWEDFHPTLNVAIAEFLTPNIAPRYVVRIDRRVYMESPGEDSELPVHWEQREARLLIRLRETMEVVTVLETLSPSNKRAGGDGRREYLHKREAVLESQAHLAELDLLRAGLRLPTVTPLRVADYYAIISRRQRRPKAGVYAWTIRDPLPTIPVPLKKSDPDVPLDLQAVFTTVYDRADYQLSLDYRAELRPPLSPDDAEWIRRLLPLST